MEALSAQLLPADLSQTVVLLKGPLEQSGKDFIVAACAYVLPAKAVIETRPISAAIFEEQVLQRRDMGSEYHSRMHTSRPYLYLRFRWPGYIVENIEPACLWVYMRAMLARTDHILELYLGNPFSTAMGT